MKLASSAFAALAVLGLALVGCNVGESEAPKPDPNKFLPAKTDNGAKPITPNSPNNPPSTP